LNNDQTLETDSRRAARLPPPQYERAQAIQSILLPYSKLSWADSYHEEGDDEN